MGNAEDAIGIDNIDEDTDAIDTEDDAVDTDDIDEEGDDAIAIECDVDEDAMGMNDDDDV